MTSQAFGYQIEEITGSRRTVVLRGRALPYRAVGLAWEGRQRHTLTWYAGNPQATLQVLGPEEMPQQIEGMWKDRFLAGQVTLTGFPGVDADNLLAEDLVRIFDDIRVSGNALRVQWGPFVREGILAHFRALPERIEDIKWEAKFVWFARDDQRVPRAAPEADPSPNLRSRLNDVDDELAFSPPTINPDFRALTVSRIASVRQQVGTIFDQVRQVDGLIRTPLDALGAISSASEAIRFETEAELGRLIEAPFETVQSVDRVADIFKAEGWRRTMGRTFSRLRASAQKRERETRQAARPGAIQIITVKGDTSLRQISLNVYGTSDSWQLIADVNNLEGSIVESGTVLVIPPPPTTRGGIQRGDLPT